MFLFSVITAISLAITLALQPIQTSPLISEKSHLKGMQLIDQGESLPRAIKLCQENLRFSCLHGAVMEYIETNYNNAPPKQIVMLCKTLNLSRKKYLNCLHAAGHEIYAFNSKNNVNSILQACDMSDYEESHACVSGIFMEYSKADIEDIPAHSHKSAGKINPPCSQVAGKFKRTCYTSTGFYWHYGQPKSLIDSFIHCHQNVPNNFLFDCLVGAIKS